MCDRDICGLFFFAYIGEGLGSEILEPYLVVLMQANVGKFLGFGALGDSQEGNWIGVFHDFGVIVGWLVQRYFQSICSFYNFGCLVGK
jgi:hypothetical protein